MTAANKEPQESKKDTDSYEGSTDEELCYTPATELVKLITGKSLSPIELMDAVLARLEKLNPKLNAICTPTVEKARALASVAESMVMHDKPLGALHGIPLTIKDTIYTKDIRTMMGSRLKADFIPTEDAPLVTRLRDAGAFPLVRQRYQNTPGR